MLRNALVKNRTRGRNAIPTYELRRVGRNVVIVGGNGYINASNDNMSNLQKLISDDSKPVKIRTNGLSRAQVVKVVHDLQTNTNNKYRIALRRISSAKSPLAYDITVMEGVRQWIR